MDIQFQYLRKPDSAPAPSKKEVSFSDADYILIGRESSCDVVLPCEEKIISRHHARISKIGSHYTITDISANGTYLNKEEEPIGNGRSIDISNDDIIRLGEYQLKFRIKDKDGFNRLNAQHKPKVNVAKTEARQSKLNHVPAKRRTSPPNENFSQKSNEGSPLGSVNESFAPPHSVIPKDWDMTLKPKSTKHETNVPSSLKKSMEFSQQDSELINSLLKGLGITKSAETNDLSPEKMLAIGRCLRASVAGMIKQRDHVDNIKSKLCYSENKMLKNMNYSSLADFNTADEFLKEMIAGNRKTHAEFPLEVLKCQKEIMEDQAVIYKSFNKSIDSFREELSPFSVEKIYKEKNNNLAEKLVPSIGKWEIYKNRWSQKCMSFKKTIQLHFEENIKELHKKRIEDRQLLKKKK
ncbi:MAG: type VI secretion system-associated FHA domain protein [Cellvibrionaceae bacterium]